MEVKIINKSKHNLPEYATPYSAGMDLRANIEQPIVLKPLQRMLIPTGYTFFPGLFAAILLSAVMAQIRPRSGLAYKHGISIVNAPGTIDADYRGEIGVILVNLSDQDFVVNDGERICQMVVAKHERVEWTSVESLEESERGDGGFGHTGKK